MHFISIICIRQKKLELCNFMNVKNAKNMEPTHNSQYSLCKGNNKKA